jgi:heme/copper-type cytochrome/quinol oxidase subunit 2
MCVCVFCLRLCVSVTHKSHHVLFVCLCVWCVCMGVWCVCMCEFAARARARTHTHTHTHTKHRTKMKTAHWTCVQGGQRPRSMRASPIRSRWCVCVCVCVCLFGCPHTHTHTHTHTGGNTPRGRRVLLCILFDVLLLLSLLFLFYYYFTKVEKLREIKAHFTTRSVL